jgi:CheY-like chemotaxis protein
MDEPKQTNDRSQSPEVKPFSGVQELDPAARAKDEFLATLAHELRNPLAPLRNAAHILRREKTVSSQSQWALEVIERQTQHMTRLIDDLLDVSRITQNKLELRTLRVEFAEVVRVAVETSRPLIEAAGHELTVVLPSAALFLNADLTRLSQALANLLNNAAKYTERGGHVWLAAERQGSDVVITVRDNGTGIPPEMLPRVFDMFTQVSRTLNRSQGGLGIGLSLVKRLVELHGGTVQVKSEGRGKGSEFIVRLPVIVESAVQPERIDVDGEIAGAGASLRILIADDNRDSADSLAILLRMTGNDVRAVYDGAAAVSAVREYSPNVALLDIGMPELSGYQAAQQIRGMIGGGDVVLIALTGWGQDGDRQRSREAGFDYHMVKPVNPDSLLKLLATIQKRHAGDAVAPH